MTRQRYQVNTYVNEPKQREGWHLASRHLGVSVSAIIAILGEDLETLPDSPLFQFLTTGEKDYITRMRAYDTGNRERRKR